MRLQQAEPRDAADVVDMWREEHADTMAWVERRVSYRLGTARVEHKVAQRLKRKPQIVRKLLRSGHMRLSQMQDVAGCRALVPGLPEIDVARERIVRQAAPHFEVKSESDYRLEGRSTMAEISRDGDQFKPAC